MKTGTKAATMQVEVYYGFVAVSMFIEHRKHILERHSPSPQAAKDAHLVQFAEDTNALIALYGKQHGRHSRQGGPPAAKVHREL